MRRKFIKKCNEFPRISRRNHSVASDQSPLYNCISFAAGEITRKWWPVPDYSTDAYWPDGVPRSDSTKNFVEAFATLGYEVCQDGSYEKGLEKIAFYGLGGAVKHAAIQIGQDRWASKLGDFEDIHHKVQAVSGGLYGEVIVYMSRRASQLDIAD